MSVTVLHPEPADRPTRFRLHRAGLIGLYEYEDETFEFERGRLLLRGPNGSGKSKALELLLPLLLDGELRAERLDPFGGRGRSMRWNLIGEQEARGPAVGYSWLELHRRDEHGVEHFRTLVLMARANKGEGGVHSWFALLAAQRAPGGELQGPRLGVNASLTDSRHPISRAAFAELAGELIESASVYRERVNALLFGVSQDRYDAIVRLLLSLRKPQLSQTLDPQELSARLTEALPELDRDAVLRVSSRLDQLDRLRAEAAELRHVRGAVEAFAKTYRDWARAALRDRGGALIESVRAREQQEEALTRAQAAAEEASERRSGVALRRQQLASSLASARGAERELRASEDWRAAERLEELRRLAEGAAAAAAAASAELERAQAERAEFLGAAERADAALAEQRTLVGSLLQLCSAEANRASVAAHAAGIEAIVEEPRDLPAVRALLEQLAATRAEAIAAMAELARALRVADQEFRAGRARFEDAETRQRERQAERAAAATRLEPQALEGWLAALEQLPIDEAFADELADMIARAGDPGAPAAREQAAERAEAAEQRLREQLAAVTASRSALAAKREPLAAEHARLSADEDPVPEPLPFRTADRAGRGGAPLWALVDFTDGLDGRQRAGLEGALERVLLSDGAPASGDDGAAVGFDGGFALGPLRGRRRAEAARYIGAAARAANRACRLCELERELAKIEHRDRELEAAAAELDAAVACLREELRRLPDDAPALRAYVQLERARAEEQRAAAVTAAEQQTMAARADEREQARDRALAHARGHRLPAPEDEAGLATVRDALASYRAACGELIGAEFLARERQRAAGAARDHADRAGRTLTTAQDRARACEQEASARGGAHREAAEAVGASVEQLRARLAELEAEAGGAERGLRDAHEQDVAAASEHAAAERDVAHAHAGLVDAEREVAGKHGRVASLGRLGAWPLALGDGAPEDHASAGSWPLERTLGALRGVSRESLVTRRGFETLLADVDREADELRHHLSANADFQVSRERVLDDAELTLVQVRPGGRSHPIGELDLWLEGELHARERTIAEEDRRLFESAVWRMRCAIGSAPPARSSPA